MVLGFWIGLRKASRVTHIMNKVPVPISVIIPIRNEEQNICNLLESLSRVDYPWELFEIILINDHSTDSSWSNAQQWECILRNLILLELPPSLSGKKAALSYGVSMAKHRIVVFTDADCEFTSEWLSEISNSYRTRKWCMLIGPVIIAPTYTAFHKMQSLEYASLTASSIGACALGYPIMASAANLAFDKKSTEFEMNIMNPCQPSGDDVFFLHNLKRKRCSNISYIHSLGAAVRTKPVASISQFISQRSRWASKATAYTDSHTIAIAIVVFTFNLMLFALAFTILFWPNLLPLLFIGYALKVCIDFPLLKSFLKRYEASKLLSVYLPLQLIYPFYIVIAFTVSQLGAIKWKGRKNE
jgi:glycosyltransferase involved in cell wall biosynthesis